MICPNCLKNAPSDVTETRAHKGLIKRYRKCSNCSHIYATVEYVILKTKQRSNPMLGVIPLVDLYTDDAQ